MQLFAYQFRDSDYLAGILSSQGISIERYYRDTLVHRPALANLLADCRAAPPDYVLVESVLALAHDDTALQSALETFWDCRVGVVALSNLKSSGNKDHEPMLLVPADWTIPALQLGRLPSAKRLTPEDWLAIGMHLQSGQQRRMIQQGHRQNRLKQLPPPGKAPYGYRRGKTSYLVDLRAAPVVKGFYEHFLLYGCLRGAARFVGKTYGKSISPSTGKRWLTHPVYRGHLCYRQSEIISNTHPPLLAPLEAAQVDRLLRRNQRFSARSASAPRSLSGLVHCASCGSGMTISQVTKAQRHYLYLRPQTCQAEAKCPGLAYDQVLEKTIAAICNRLPTAIAALQLPQNNPKQVLTRQIEAQQQILAQIPSLLDAGVLDEETAQLRMYNLERDLSELNQQLARFPPVNLAETAQAIAIPEFWQDLSESERRFYLREFIHSVQITRSGQDWDLILRFVFEKS